MKPGNVRPTAATEPATARPARTLAASATARKSCASARRGKRLSMRQAGAVHREPAAAAAERGEVLEVHHGVEEEVRRPEEPRVLPEPPRAAQEGAPVVEAVLEPVHAPLERPGGPAGEVEDEVLEVVEPPVADADPARGLELRVGARAGER